MAKTRYIPLFGGGGEAPTGDLPISITQNGEQQYDVADYATATVDVQVPASEVDTGTLQTPITTNGTQTIDVIGYADHEIDVQVPASAVDTGTLQTPITTNGTRTIDVTGYASHEISVAVPAPYLTMTQAQYNALSPNYDPDTLYLITD